MAVDIESLRRHYASLSNEALLDVNRDELVAAAQSCYDEEVTQRGLVASEAPEEDGVVLTPDENEPEWIEEAAEVYSILIRPGLSGASDIDAARSALSEAGVPSYLDVLEEPSEDPGVPPTQRWRLLVPGEMNLQATSILERDIFNAEFEAVWRHHLETLSDEQLEATEPQDVLCGLFDRVQRVLQAYEDEWERRGLPINPA